MDLSNLRLMNAAGWCKDVATVRKLSRTPVVEITVGSITKETRPGNEGSVFWQSPDGTYALNSLGLPNPGIEKYREILPEMQAIANDAGKALRVSIAGFSPVEYAELAHAVAPHADVIEINLGCPNVWGEGGQKPIASFDVSLMREILDGVGKVTSGIDVDVAAKVSPYSDPGLLAKVIDLLKMFEFSVSEVVTSNTFPNAFAWDGEKTAITAGGGFAGMSGRAMKGIALGQAQRFRSELPFIAGEDDLPAMETVGVGGITCGRDILDYMRCGITSLQVGTHYFVHGEKVFSELLAECAELV